ncbi:hypothetical protein GDO81_027441 [Engystomops pustulosus]|uniref:C2 domain-containing protein n=1 Tax=Engystomops pustulosus TaxID=76066 RepID=A0AAV6YQ76_ENGPU|nr:hypothetical protein GDO81_027441 [Engystomops pustulosus]
MSPIAAGFIGAAVLVVSVSVGVFIWSCCHGRSEKKFKNPPYKFIHMLKGISIYPEALSNKKKTFRVRRDKSRVDGDSVEAGLVGAEKGPNGLATAVNQLPINPHYGEEASPSVSTSSSGSKRSSPSSPDEEAALGTLTISVDYNFPKKALVVTIQEAHSLPVMDEHSQGSDPYIKMTILPDKKHRVKTRVLRKTLDPVFDETFTFYGIPYSQLQDLVLHFLVLSFDRFSRDDVIGEVMVPLSGVDPSTGRVQISRDIVRRNIQKCVSRGELQVSLSYQPVAQRMTVVVLKAKHLPRMDITGLSGSSYLSTIDSSPTSQTKAPTLLLWILPRLYPATPAEITYGPTQLYKPFLSRSSSNPSSHNFFFHPLLSVPSLYGSLLQSLPVLYGSPLLPSSTSPCPLWVFSCISTPVLLNLFY